MTTKKRSRTRTVTLSDGRVFPLALPEVTGEGPCPGEAHKNAHIDHCMDCLHHRWGVVPTYATIDVAAACSVGHVVAVNDLPESVDFHELTKRESNLCLIRATEKKRGCTSDFYVIAPKEET